MNVRALDFPVYQLYKNNVNVNGIMDAPILACPLLQTLFRPQRPSAPAAGQTSAHTQGSKPSWAQPAGRKMKAERQDKRVNFAKESDEIKESTSQERATHDARLLSQRAQLRVAAGAGPLLRGGKP